MIYDDEVMRPYSDSKQPGRKDVDGVEWWACDPYPCWYRWDDGEVRVNHAAWLPDDPKMALRDAAILDERTLELTDKIAVLRERAARCRAVALESYVEA